MNLDTLMSCCGITGEHPLQTVSAHAENPLELRVVAEKAACVAGELLKERFHEGLEHVRDLEDQHNPSSVQTKTSRTDLVSDADRSAEHAIRNILTELRPDDAILGEEGGISGSREGLLWVVDPLDGTINYLFGLPQWCVSVAVCDAEGVVAGAVFDPLADELFVAHRGADALCNGVKLRPSSRSDLATALVGTGFSYDQQMRELQAQVICEVIPNVRDIRRLGACALDLSWLAAGRLDLFFERKVNAWDIAAGVFICTQAGLEVASLPERAVNGKLMPAGLLVGPQALLDLQQSAVLF